MMNLVALAAPPACTRSNGLPNLPAILFVGTITISVLTGADLAAQAPSLPEPLRAQYDSAYFAWDRGDYVRSLRHSERILTAPGGEALLDRVALLTGELYRVTEVTNDGQLVRWSPAGDLFTYERGTGSATTTYLVALDGDRTREVTTFRGWAATFAPDGASIAYFRLPESAEADAAREAERRARERNDPAAIREAQQRLALLESAEAEIVIRSLADGRETVIEASGISRFGLEYAGDGAPILIGREPGQGDRLDLYRLLPSGEARRMTEGPGNKGGRFFAVGDARIVYTIGADRIAVHELADDRVQVLDGTSPTVSRDGSTLAYLTTSRVVDAEIRRGEAQAGADVRASGNLVSIMLLSLDGRGEPREIKRTTLPLADPALSPSGARVAFSTILRDDWEIFVIGADGTGEVRITRDPQHDLFPQFLTETRLLGMMGEARHRRSYLYDLSADPRPGIATALLPGDDQRGRTQLFHNNTLRTVAPQYEWVSSPDGSKIAFVADRDGDTLSPERGVYLVDLDARVGTEEVLARVRSQLAAESALQERGRALFDAFEREIREAVAEVDVARIYDHAHALYQFDSKFITQPGNALAVEYLANSLRAMGYDPELQWFEPRPGLQSANVIATLRGTTAPERINVISSHFDSVERSPGADDNSSGTTALLEAARVLAERPQHETIQFAFLTAEEAGLLGAREMVRRAEARGDQIVAAINNDMVGWTRSHRLDNTIRYSNSTVRDVQHAAAFLFTDLITYDARYVRSTDAQAYWDVYGDIVGGIGSYPILGNPHYHQPHDRLEVINHRLVAEVSRATTAAIMLLASGRVDIGE